MASGTVVHLLVSMQAAQGLFSSTRSLAYLLNNEGRAYQSLRRGGGKSAASRHVARLSSILRDWWILHILTQGWDIYMDRCQLPVAEKHLSFHSCRTIDYRCWVHQAKTDLFEVEKVALAWHVELLLCTGWCGHVLVFSGLVLCIRDSSQSVRYCALL